jgi:hypothetical protein
MQRRIMWREDSIQVLKRALAREAPTLIEHADLAVSFVVNKAPGPFSVLAGHWIRRCGRVPDVPSFGRAVKNHRLLQTGTFWYNVGRG